jgi:hypothetical protein
MPKFQVRVKCPREVKVGEKTVRGQKLPEYKTIPITETFELNAADAQQARWMVTRSGPIKVRVGGRMTSAPSIGDRLRRKGCKLDDMVIEDVSHSATR